MKRTDVHSPTTLNPENTRKVIAALRSGDHQQTTGQLEDASGRRCCLGVACRVAQESGVSITVTDGEGNLKEFDGAFDAMPRSVATWLADQGADRNPTLVVPDHVRRFNDIDDYAELATTLNDDWGLTFFEIADCFEATLAEQERAT